MRAFTVAAVQLAPVPGPLSAESVTANLDRCVDHIERCMAATGAELVVLPEAATTGCTPGRGLWDLVSDASGPVTRPSRRPPAGSASTSSSAPTRAAREGRRRAAPSTTPPC
ncbi:MAG TPA: nitrilase-related carbon-nitrogen hydrolase [Mycobacteriales bacterium]|nr:nitrilase-related carbon-nitrogen hydrolase [Mycobacteriales bacterium]